jgi:hypothetical protein
MANLLDLSPDEFLFTLQEFGYSPERRDELIRQYRDHNSVFGSLNRAAQERQAEIAGEGRRPVAGGFLSKPEGSLGMDAVRGLRVEPMAGLLGMLTGAGRAVEAPAAAYQGLIPMGDVPLEALGTAGMASLGGAAMTRPAGSVGMGGRVAGGESRAQTVARLLREGRQSEVTDDLLATLTPNDNAELFRLYNEGATGMDLPMDEASRMARAREMGFDAEASRYHGTDADFQAFDPRLYGEKDSGWYGRGVTTDTDPEIASGYANYYERPEGQAVIPVMSRGRYMDWPEGHDPFFNDDVARAGTREIQRLGYDGTRMSNDRDLYGDVPDWGTEQVTFDPTNVRSRFARFDPRLSDNANLLAANRDQTVGLLSTAAAAEPRNAAERMARDILDMRAAGRAGEVTDEMMAQADPQYMFANTPLPMDEASRMVRAGEMGFDTGVPLYHGTGADFQSFDAARFQQSDFGTGGAGIYSSEAPSLAGAYADLVTRPSNDNANILPIVTRRQEAYDNGGYRNINNYEQAREYSRRMQDLGVDNVYYRDNMSGEIVENVTFDPRNVRSRFARFDPEFAHLANLNAANIDPLAGLLGASASQQGSQDNTLLDIFLRSLTQRRRQEN